jgi:hypothetical protein
MPSPISAAEFIAICLCCETARSSPWQFEEAREKPIVDFDIIVPIT